jgi:RHS repeat-associated protein
LERRSYDADGHLTNDGTFTYTYSDRGRLASVSAGSNTVSYLCNGLEQRVIKTGAASFVSTGTQVYVYDEASHLLGEYDNGLAVVDETVFLGDAPIIVLTQTVSGSPSTTTTNVYNVYTDQIGAPRVITQASSDQMVWRWDTADPFSVLAPNANPAGLGVFTYNPRLPGQLYDAETGLFYNINRNYDPILGRYVQSDPIGLKGGVNTYAYVSNDPLIWVDPLGLAKFCCRLLDSFVGTWFGKRHCYVIADDGTVYGLYPQDTIDGVIGKPRTNDPRDQGGECFDCPALQCKDQNKCLRDTAAGYPIGRYGLVAPNSNTFAGTLARSCCAGGVPAGVHGAPGIGASPPDPMSPPQPGAD